jgi:hypothetical protein
MCRDGRFSLPPPDDDANGSKAGRRDDPTRDADDDAKTYESIECPACSRVHLVNPARAEPIGRKLRITDRMLDVLYAPSKPGWPGVSWPALARIAVFIGAKSFRRGQTAIGLGHRVVNRRMYPADTVAIPPIPCQLKGLPEWMRVDLPFSISGRQFYRLDQLRIIRIRFRAIDPLRYRPTFTPQVRPNRSTRNHCGVCGRNDDRDECLYFCSLE